MWEIAKIIVVALAGFAAFNFVLIKIEKDPVDEKNGGWTFKKWYAKNLEDVWGAAAVMVVVLILAPDVGSVINQKFGIQFGDLIYAGAGPLWQLLVRLVKWLNRKG